MSNDTILTLTGMGIPDYSARGLKQALTPIEAVSVMHRTVNGTLVDVAAEQMRKYASTITGSDQEPPALEGIWPGMQLTVGCIVELATQGGDTETETGTDALERPAVAGSIRYSGGFVFYRPILTMLVTKFSVDTDEWGAAVDWTLTLEEV